MEKKISITMQVTYEVTKECEVDSDVLESLNYIQEHYLDKVGSYIVDIDDKATTGYEWMSDNCDEHKCVYWLVKIQDITEEE